MLGACTDQCAACPEPGSKLRSAGPLLFSLHQLIPAGWEQDNIGVGV